MLRLSFFIASLLCGLSCSFVVRVPIQSSQRLPVKLELSSTQSSPRTGFLQSLLDVALNSPVWKYVLVPRARQKMVDTAAENGIPWRECRDWLKSQQGLWNEQEQLDADVPSYYNQAFHAYEDGNLNWEAALEVEIASAAVGARNFPAHGRNGENAFRNSFQAALVESGATCSQDGLIVDLGCGTGMSTRRLANNYPQASKIMGIDLSPYFCEVGRSLLALQPSSIEEGGDWVSSIRSDDRISFQVGNAASTGLPDNSVDVVNLQFVAHELPHQVTLSIIREAGRVLKEGGQFWFCEMDFESPAYAAQRANALLFSLLRSTEPYLDDYADHAQEIRDCLRENFGHTVITPATGRHFSIVATKQQNTNGENVLIDQRFDESGEYRVEDTHLKVWENKV